MNIMFQEYIDRMQEVDRLKSAFLANISHEIRTPINAIVGFASMITDESIDLESRIEFGKIITHNASNLIKMLNSLLEMSFIENNQIKIDVTIQDISSLIEKKYKEFKEIIAIENPDVSLFLIKPEIPVEKFTTDHNRLNHILSILLDIAIKFTEKGRIEFFL